jgi:hypothetical protein
MGADVRDRAPPARARPNPPLPTPTARPHEKDRAMMGMLAGEDQNTVGLVETGQVVKVRVLPVLVLDVVVAHRHRR